MTNNFISCFSLLSQQEHSDCTCRFSFIRSFTLNLSLHTNNFVAHTVTGLAFKLKSKICRVSTASKHLKGKWSSPKCNSLEIHPSYCLKERASSVLLHTHPLIIHCHTDTNVLITSFLWFPSFSQNLISARHLQGQAKQEQAHSSLARDAA